MSCDVSLTALHKTTSQHKQPSHVHPSCAQVLNKHGILAELDSGVSDKPEAQVQPLLDGVPKHMHSVVKRLAKLSKRRGSESTSALWAEIAR